MSNAAGMDTRMSRNKQSTEHPKIVAEVSRDHIFRSILCTLYTLYSKHTIILPNTMVDNNMIY